MVNSLLHVPIGKKRNIRSAVIIYLIQHRSFIDKRMIVNQFPTPDPSLPSFILFSLTREAIPVLNTLFTLAEASIFTRGASSNQ